jgi:hypothetical protein
MRWAKWLALRAQVLHTHRHGRAFLSAYFAKPPVARGTLAESSRTYRLGVGDASAVASSRAVKRLSQQRGGESFDDREFIAEHRAQALGLGETVREFGSDATLFGERGQRNCDFSDLAGRNVWPAEVVIVFRAPGEAREQAQNLAIEWFDTHLKNGR